MNLNVSSFYKSDYKEGRILNSVFQIKQIQRHTLFKDFCNKVIKDLNITNDRWDLDMFFSMAPGSSGAVHRDEYEVFILAVLGNLCFRSGNESYFLKPGDAISFKRGEPHQGIGLDPRISLSFGYGF